MFQRVVFGASSDASLIAKAISAPGRRDRPGSVADAHAVDECVEVTELAQAARLYLALLFRVPAS
jgi:acetylornithine deacetylase/succinyl-diaminopimelate desuccinylase-like protein